MLLLRRGGVSGQRRLRGIALEPSGSVATFDHSLAALTNVSSDFKIETRFLSYESAVRGKPGNPQKYKGINKNLP